MQVSVLMPVYNGERFVAEAIESVLAQTHPRFELLIIDDGSTDSTPAIIRAFAKSDHRIRQISQRNTGVTIALIRAVELAQHEWLVRMDADDVMLPYRISRQLAFLERHPEIAVAGSFVDYIDESGAVRGTGTSEFVTQKSVANALRNGQLVSISHPTAIMRKSVAKSVGSYRTEFTQAQDLDLWNRIVERGHGILVQPEVLLRYRIHSRSVSMTHARQSADQSLWIQQCTNARREGRAEPTWADYISAKRRAPFYLRLNNERTTMSHALYKQAACHYAGRRWLAFCTSFAVAALLRPVTVPPMALRKLGGRLRQRTPVSSLENLAAQTTGADGCSQGNSL